MTNLDAAAARSGTFAIGGDRPVHRLGFGAMQLTGPGHWGPPRFADRAAETLRTAMDLGINHIDTADAYGPHSCEELIRYTLAPYPPDLVIATKGGMTRQGPNQWQPHGHPAYLRQCIDGSLQRLGLDTIDLYYLHRIDPAYPLADQLGVLADAQANGKIRHIGISKVTPDQLREARQHANIAAVQNRHNPADLDNDVLADCTATNTAYVPYAPFGAGQFSGHASEVIAWHMAQSPVVLPIPGTSSAQHLRDNASAAATDRTH